MTRATTFPIEVDVTCKVASGNSLYLVSEIANADGRGTTEYYLLTSWNISTTETAPQYWSVKAAPNTVRKYFLISVSPEQLAKIRTSGNAAADGGYLSLMSAVVVSNTQTTQTR